MNYFIIRRRPFDGRFQDVAIGFPGMIGAIDIINAKGLVFFFNQLGFGKGNLTEPVFIMFRRISETCSFMEEALPEILNAAKGMPFIITVSDSSFGTALLPFWIKVTLSLSE